MFGFKKKEKFPNIDWYCDSCNDYLNSQSGFYDGCGNWTCTNCGHINPIAEDEINWEDDFGNDESYHLNDYDDILSEPGCAACGNPAYPNCKPSCSMFDD